MVRPSRQVPIASTESVIIGVEPHKRSHTAAVVAGQQVVDQLRVAATRTGIQQLQRWANQWPERQWAIENAYGLGRTLSQTLLKAGESVLDVPPALSRRVRLLSGKSGRKTDRRCRRGQHGTCRDRTWCAAHQPIRRCA